MTLNRYKLGTLIEQRREKNKNYNYPIRGVSREGFIEPKQKDADTSLYNVFYRNDFVFNPARMEINSIALNTELDCGICSSLYEIFYIKNTEVLLPEYLNLFVKRDEFARRCEFIGWGSAREYCRVGNISDIEIELPSIEIQRKYVAIYKAVVENQKNYEKGLDDLKLTCDIYIENLRKKFTSEELDLYINSYNKKVKDVNKEYSVDNIAGISSVEKKFIETKADTNGLSVNNYNIVPKRFFAFNPNTARMGDKIPIALNDTDNEVVVSAIYPVFGCKTDKLIPEYLAMFFVRSEFDRYARFHSWGSARETFNWNDMIKVKIPIPSIDIQQDIVNIYNTYILRKEINEKLKEQIKNICPILIKGSLEEAKSN